jgi:hypothetical protein
MVRGIHGHDIVSMLSARHPLLVVSDSNASEREYCQTTFTTVFRCIADRSEWHVAAICYAKTVRLKVSLAWRETMNVICELPRKVPDRTSGHGERAFGFVIVAAARGAGLA